MTTPSYQTAGARAAEEKKQQATQVQQNNNNKPGADNGKSLPTPILMLLCVVLAFVVQQVLMKYSTLAEEDLKFNPQPKGLKENEVVILYCTS